MATIKDVANKANVSVATVSRVINNNGYVNEETKRNVQRVIDEMHYVPNQLARSLFLKKSKIIGVLVTKFSNDFVSELVDSIEKVASDNGYNIMICSSQDIPEREDRIIKVFEEYNVDGILLMTNTNKFQNYTSLNIPIVTIDHIIEGIPFVSSNNFEGGMLAAKKLLERNPKKMIHFRGPSILFTVKDRTAGFNKIIEEKHIEVIEKDFPFEKANDQEFYEVLKNNLDVDAIFCDSDVLALKTLQAASKLNLSSPNDFWIIGFDGSEMSKLSSPSLTTVNQSISEIGKTSVLKLLKLINKEKVNMVDYIPVNLIERESTE